MKDHGEAGRSLTGRRSGGRAAVAILSSGMLAAALLTGNSAALAAPDTGAGGGGGQESADDSRDSQLAQAADSSRGEDGLRSTLSPTQRSTALTSGRRCRA